MNNKMYYILHFNNTQVNLFEKKCLQWFFVQNFWLLFSKSWDSLKSTVASSVAKRRVAAFVRIWCVAATVVVSSLAFVNRNSLQTSRFLNLYSSFYLHSKDFLCVLQVLWPPSKMDNHTKLKGGIESR